MSNGHYYLKPNVQLEPLFNQWYAWPHLIAPATAAMNIANLHVRIMKSFVMAPQVHAAAVKNPAMRGGPFLDVDCGRVGEVRELMERTVAEQGGMLEFADAVKSLSQTLAAEAKGSSLEALYEKVPEALKGYVELVYDLNNNPQIRFIEGLLYRSPYYNPPSQAAALSTVEGDDRPFVFSTPRLEEDDRLRLKIPFSHRGIDALFRMRRSPRAFGEIKEELALEDKDDARLLSLLTREEPRRREKYIGEQVRVRYFGHACVLIETKDVSILTDPIISYDYDNEVPRYTFADLPDEIDYVLLTHNHSDHVLFETLLQLRHKVKNVVVPRGGGGALEDPSLKLILAHTGFDNVIEIDEMESIRINGGEIIGVPFLGEHGDLNVKSKIAHFVSLGGKNILCAADSSNLEPRLYEHIRRQVGDVDVLFLGMECDGAPVSWMYGPLLPRPRDRMLDHSGLRAGSECARARDFVERFNCKQVYVYAMGQEPWLNFITSIHYTEASKPIVESNRLVNACRQSGILAERLFCSKQIFV